MNQDSNVSEAFKMRNLLAELAPGYTDRKGTAQHLARPLAATPVAVAEGEADEEEGGGGGPGASPAISAAGFHAQLMQRKEAERPVALVGGRL